ncbi:unnamed protein product [Sympodiomycopsis kandeliae]
MPSKRDSGLMPDAQTRATQEAAKQVQRLQQHHNRSLLDFLQALTSIVFRLGAYLFLRWIPGKATWPALPIVYTIYLLTWLIKDVGVRTAIRNWENAVPSKDLKELANGVSIGKEKIGSQVGNSHKAETNSQSAVTATNVSPPSSGFFGKIFALITGLSVPNRNINLFNLAVHTTLLGLFLDSFASPYLFPSHYDHNLIFHRVGDIGPTHAKIQVRWPEPIPLFEGLEETTQGSGILRDGSERVEKPFRLVYREINSPIDGSLAAGRAANRWERGPLIPLSPEDDWVSTVSLSNLWPSTEYEYRLAWAHNNTFVSPHRLLDFQGEWHGSGSLLSASNVNFVGGRLKTWPDPRTGQGLGGLAVGSESDVLEDEEGLNVPTDDPNHFLFLTSSCVRPDFPYQPSHFPLWSWLLQLLPSPFQFLPDQLKPYLLSPAHSRLSEETDDWARRNTIRGFDLMYEKYVKGVKTPSPRFFLQLGDLIYADVPYFGGPFVSAYRKLYRNLFASASFRRVFSAIPTIGIYDDHEVINNWAGLTETGARIEEFEPANSAWHNYVGQANPEPLADGDNYFTFRYGSETAFFVMDTRKHRVASSGFGSDGEVDEDDVQNDVSGQPYKTMLGQEQKDSLVRWLSAVNSTATFKIISSSVPVLSLWGGIDGKKDTWAAYLSEREELLEILQYIPNVILLSGDRHEFAMVGIRSLSSSHTDAYPVTELSTSPLNMFYVPLFRTLSLENGRGPTGQEFIYDYTYKGNHKWTSIEINTKNVLSPKMIIRLFIDGKMEKKWTYLGKPIKKEIRTIGSLAKSFLELLGFTNRRWF